MKYDKKLVRPEPRARGRIFQTLIPYFTEREFRLANRFLDRFLKGRWLGKHTVIEQHTIPQADGSELRLCVCQAKGGAKVGATGLLWLHGGGYALGLPEQDSAFVDRFCGDGSCIAVAPDYQRATERPYPAALEDAYATLVWMKENAESLSIRSDQLFVGGDSAGGGLCTALCLYARDKGDVSIAFQMPLYPMLDDRMETDSARNNNAPVWNSRSNETAWRLYLSDPADSGAIPPYAAPARAIDLRNLPPTCTYVSSVEPFRDETAAYAGRLQAQGVPVHFREFAGCYHAFDIICPNSGAAKEASEFLMQTFRYAQAEYFAAQPVKRAAKA